MLLIFNLTLDIVVLLLLIILVIKRRSYEKEEKLLADQEIFLGELVSEYAKREDMLEAMEESMHICGSDLQQEVSNLMEALKTDGFSEESGYYSKRAKNAYFVLFFTLCHTIRAFGDMELGGVSLFAHNIRYIKEEVRMEILRRQEGRYAFLGLTMLGLIPFFLTIPIECWCRGISEGISRYYVGTYGFTTLVVCFVCTVLCTLGVQQLQYPTMPDGQKDRLEKRLLSVSLIAGWVDRMIAANYSKYLKKNEELKVLQGFGNIREFLVRKWVFAVGSAGIMALVQSGYQIVAFVNRAGKTQNRSDGNVIMLLLLLMSAVLGYWLPEAWAVILKSRVGRQKVEETLRFETLILIVMHYSQITVEEILRWMERFSVIFSGAFQRAVDDFSYRRRESLEQLKEDLAYEPAKKLVDCLIFCDEITIEQAFYDLEGERAYDMDQYKQKMVALQREKAALARVVAYIPFVMILALRLIVPFVMEGLTQLGSY